MDPRVKVWKFLQTHKRFNFSTRILGQFSNQLPIFTWITNIHPYSVADLVSLLLQVQENATLRNFLHSYTYLLNQKASPLKFSKFLNSRKNFTIFRKQILQVGLHNAQSLNSKAPVHNFSLIFTKILKFRWLLKKFSKIFHPVPPLKIWNSKHMICRTWGKSATVHTLDLRAWIWSRSPIFRIEGSWLWSQSLIFEIGVWL